MLFLTSCISMDQKSAKIQIISETVNLGTVQPEKSVVGNFTVYSIGTDSLKILSTVASCGCTEVEINKKTIAPGDSAQLSFTYTAEKSIGEIKKSIVLRTNDRARPHSVLWINGAVGEPK